MQNQVTLFSSGMGHFIRHYNVSQDIHEKIPFKKDDIGDVLSSFLVFGDVKYLSPPRFTPVGADSTALDICPNNSLSSVLTNLSGAAVKINGNEGVLVGIDTREQDKGTYKTTVVDVVYMSNGLIKKISLSDVDDVKFLDSAVQSEINKALSKNFQQVKPDSTFLEFDLTKTNLQPEVQATVQYAVPVAAWKMRYSIRQRDNAYFFEGSAIVDNNTEEDWDDFIVSVVTGNPISFSTDLAQIKQPQRKHVDLVAMTALGNVDVEEGKWLAQGKTRAMAFGGAVKGARSSSDYCSFAEVGNAPDAGLLYNAPIAAPEVETKDIGDFCVFTAKEPVTIESKRSAIIPMFTQPLKTADTTLLYKESEHSRRPFRAVRFQNSTPYSLGKGKCTVYQDGLFSGESVLEATKPNDSRMLPFCLENGVKIVKEIKSHDNVRKAVRVSDGVLISEYLETSETVYNITNKKEEAFKLSLEHNKVICSSLVDFDGAPTEKLEKLTNAVRITFDIKPNEHREVIATETCVSSQEICLKELYILREVYKEDSSVLDNKPIQECIKLQEEMDNLEEKMLELQDRKKDLVAQSEELREDISSVGSEAKGTTVEQWISRLDSNRTEIRTISDKIPSLRKEVNELKTKMRDKLKEVVYVWR